MRAGIQGLNRVGNGIFQGLFQLFPVSRNAVVELAHSDVILVNKLHPVEREVFLRDMFFAVGNFYTASQRLDTNILHAIPPTVWEQPSQVAYCPHDHIVWQRTAVTRR